MSDDLQLLLDWEPRWQAFVGNLGSVMQRASGPLQPDHSRPRYGSFAASLLLHVAMVALTFSLWNSGFIRTEPHMILPDYSHAVYYPASDLPLINDRGGAEQGTTGKSGGSEAFHPRQAIRIARGRKLLPRVVDAPRLKLPVTNDPVANLLALGGPLAPSMPVDRMQRSLTQATLNQAAMPVAPAPDDPTALPSMRSKLAVPTDIVHPAPKNISRSLAQARLDASVNVVQPAPENISRQMLPTNLGLPVNVVRPAADNTSRQIAQANLAAMPAGVVQPAAENMPRTIAEARLSAPVGVVQPAAANISRGVASSKLSAPLGVVQPAAGNLSRGTSQIASLAGAPKPGIAPPEVSAGGNGHGGVSGGTSGSTSSASGEPGAGGNGGPMGIIVSLHPGQKIGIPPEQAPGALALSPSGGSGNGYGGSGTGSGIGQGKGTGSGASGTGPGAGKSGAGLGADANAKGGSSLSPGQGGTGSGNNTLMAGITVRGNTVSLPGFSGGGPSGVDPSNPSLPLGPRHNPALMIIASPRAGGALAKYGALKAPKVYTIYIDTELGTAVLQYGDASPSPTQFREDLTAPELQHAEYPSGVTNKLHLVVSCLIEPGGSLKNLHIIESSNSQLAAKMVAALAHWKFRPALRGDTAVEAEAIFGFGIDTR
jgi:hypothetical protein